MLSRYKYFTNCADFLYLFFASKNLKIKSEDGYGVAQCTSDWATYRFHQSTFEQIKQSVKKAKAALQDRNTFLASSAFRYLKQQYFLIKKTLT